MSLVTIDEIQKAYQKLPDYLFEYINQINPFVFLDFEVFKYDWLLCFSVDGIHIKSIINDKNKLRELFLNRLNDRIMVAYNANGYDKLIMQALLNDIDVKEVNDNIIKTFNFNFNNKYGSRVINGKDLMWFDPLTRNASSLKTYEACEGENIYESKVSFDLDRKLIPAEIEETKQYCSFDVKQLIKYFYREVFDSFLGHVGLIKSTIDTRKSYTFSKCLPKTDASLVGIYLCSGPGIDPTKPNDKIILPDNIDLGKYKDQILNFLDIPISILKNGQYNGLNSWCLKVIKKSINRCNDNEPLDKLLNKEEKALNKIKKLKLEKQKLDNKDPAKLTDKQKIKLSELPDNLNAAVEALQKIRKSIDKEKDMINQLKILVNELNNYECKDYCNPEYNKILIDIINIAKVSDNKKIEILTSYLTCDETKLFKIRYKEDKKATAYNDIMIEYAFEVILNIKGIPHAFKTGGIHSVYDHCLLFDKNDEHNKNRRLLIADVGSLYPNLMRVFGLCSIAMDDPKAYAQMIFDRIKLKKAGDPFAGVLKLILNTTYGCMGSIYNNLYDPSNRLRVCIFGQAAIVDLLDKLEDQIPTLEIFQSNTDGIVVSCEDDEYDDVVRIIHDWENRTGLEMEIDECLYLSQKDVSNYILIEK